MRRTIVMSVVGELGDAGFAGWDYGAGILRAADAVDVAGIVV